MIINDWNTFAAWSGATVSLGILIWDIIKASREGARLRVTCRPNMLFMNSDSTFSERKHVSVAVVNRGNLPTTVTHLVVHFYSSRLQRLLRKPQEQGCILQQHHFTPQLPYVLRPGEIWSGIVYQDEVQALANSSKLPYVSIGVSHSVSKNSCFDNLKTKELLND